MQENFSKGATMKEVHKQKSLFDPAIVKRALVDSIKKLNPAVLYKNPVMFVVEIGAVVTTYYYIAQASGSLEGNAAFSGWISIWLWYTVLFATFAEAMAEGRGKAQADALRKTKTETSAKKIDANGKVIVIGATELRKEDIVLVEA